ncbi:hypothetical protein BH10BAC4_BH10BAC4_23080 [soil metagenome]
MDIKDFQKSLHRYRNGQCTEDEIRKIDLWFYKIEDGNLGLNDFEKEIIKKEILIGLQLKSMKENNRKNRDRSLSAILLLKVAAGITVFFIVGYYFLINRSHLSKINLSVATNVNELITIKNQLKEVKQIQLPDGSAVHLKPESEISYSREWTKENREVYLVGEAFFEITKNPERPFLVHSGNIITRVLGTSFLVRALADSKSVEVKVRTGKVSVYEESLLPAYGHQPIASGVILTPNQQVEYFKSDKQWVTSLVEEPKPLHPIAESNDFVFDDSTLKSIIKQI